MTFADYQYVLMSSKDLDGNVIATKEETAEPFAMTSLMYAKKHSEFRAGMGSGGDEGVSVFGIVEDSSYIKLSGEEENEVYISTAFAKKFDLSKGDTIDLHAEYENKEYSFKVRDLIEYDGGIAVFMDIDHFNEVFEKEEGDFSGYLSRNKIKDIDDDLIAAVFTADDIRKISNQLDHSRGGAMEVFKYALIVMTAALIYLLAKIIIERNEHAISMVKILGFKNGEIASLYMVPTAIIVILFSLIAFGVGYWLMVWIFKSFMLRLDGYFAYYMKTGSMVLSILYLLIGYAFVSILDYIRIKKIPLDVALKNVE